MADAEFFEVPGPTGDTGGGEATGQGASSSPAPVNSDPNQDRLDRLTTAIDGMMQREQKRELQRETTDRKGEETQRVVNAIRAKQQEGQALRDKLAEAYDEGEGAKIAAAQQAMSENAAQVERMKSEGTAYLKQFDEPEQSEEMDTRQLDDWTSRNSAWYGVDNAMTQAAHGFDAEIRSQGIIENGTAAYFQAIDQKMRQKFPEKFNGSPGATSQPQDTAGTGAKVTRIPVEVAEGWRRMGINIDDPETAQRMVRHRQNAVDKGILQQTPSYGRVR